MNIIPVIDLKDGQVVSAYQGKRDSYRPLNSALCPSSSIDDVIKSYLSVYPFKTIYIADLNAISNTGSNQSIIDNVIIDEQDINFWVDNGTKIQNLSAQTNIPYTLIIGSENQTKNKAYPMDSRYKKNILSLDYFPDTGYTGPEELLNNSDSWPNNIIVMTLDRVGENKGPDFVKLACFCQKHPDKTIIAAGGIRNETDLLKLRVMGINHALVASALHSGAINSEAIKKLISIAP